MNKKVSGLFGTVLLAFAIVCVVFSCAFGFLPAGTGDREATFSLRLSGLVYPDGRDASRAIVQGPAYIYIRTVGGPTGSSGPYYGPYAVSSGASFSTTDIPAGSFSDMGIILSASKLDEAATFLFKGSQYTFPQLMRLSDAEFLELTGDGGSGSGIGLDEFFNGEASGGLTGPVTLRQGQTTNISAVLFPFTGSAYRINLYASQTMVLPARSSLGRKFYELEGVPSLNGSSNADVSCSVIPSSGASVTLGMVALYDDNGALVQADTAGSVITAAKKYAATINTGSHMYLYLEYASASPVTLSFSVNGGNLIINFAGDASVAGKRLFFGAYDISNISPSEIGYGPLGTLVGVGVMTLDSSGSGAMSAVDPSTHAIASVVPYKPYVVYAFVDMNGNYGSLSVDSLQSSTFAKMIVPCHGDYANDGSAFVPIDTGYTCPIKLADMTLSTEYVYFVKSGGSGSGATYLSPANLDFAMNDISANARPESVVYFMTDISVTTAYAVSTDIRFCPVDQSAPVTLNLQPDNTNAAYFTIDSGGSITLFNVVVDGSAWPNAPRSAFDVSGSLVMFTGSVIRNVSVMSELASGGAVSLSAGSLIMMMDAKIQNCSSLYYYGGGVALIASGSLFSMSGTSSITGCSAPYGGGVYVIDTYCVMSLGDSVLISGNHADSWGGGAYANFDPVSPFDGFATYIVNNTYGAGPTAQADGFSFLQ